MMGFGTDLGVQGLELGLKAQNTGLGLHSHCHEYESRYPCTGYSKHEFECIPVAAAHINTSSVSVPIALIRVVFAQVLFLSNRHK